MRPLLEVLRVYDDDEHAALASTVRTFVARELAPHELPVDRAGEVAPELLRDLQSKARDLGLYGFNMPADVGGPGLSAVEHVVVREQLGRTTQAMAEAAYRPPGCLALAGEEQRRRYIEPMMRGKRSFALALTEADSGSDIRSPSLRAERLDEGTYRLNGSKQFVSNLHVADCVVVLAREIGEDGSEVGPTAFIVEASDSGFTAGPEEPKMGWRGYPFAELTLQNCVLPADRRLGASGAGLSVALVSVNQSRLSVSAHCVGAATHLLEQTVERVERRHLFGATLASRQGVQWQLYDMYARVLASRTLLYKVASMLDADVTDTRTLQRLTALVKAECTESAFEVADMALQLHGAYGYTQASGIELRVRDLRAYRIGEGATELLKDQVARGIVDGRT